MKRRKKERKKERKRERESWESKFLEARHSNWRRRGEERETGGGGVWGPKGESGSGEVRSESGVHKTTGVETQREREREQGRGRESKRERERGKESEREREREIESREERAERRKRE